MKKGWIIVITAVITFIATSVLWVVIGTVAFGMYMSSDFLGVLEDAPFSLSVDAAEEVALQETFPFTVTVSNPTADPLELTSLDIYDEQLDGFEVIQVVPEPDEVEDFGSFKVYYFHQPLASGETLQFVYTLKAVRPGMWSGDVDACAPDGGFVTVVPEIEVIPGESTP